MSNWVKKNLEDMADYINGYPFKPSDWKRSGLPIIRIAQMTGSQSNYDYFDGQIENKYYVNNGDLLFSWSGTLMTMFWEKGPAVVNQHIFKVVPKSGVNKYFLHFVLNYALGDLRRRSHGSTIKHIKSGDLKSYIINCPTEQEQKKIVEILTSVDRVIELKKKKINKLKDLKKGVVQELLIKGIGHTEFKDGPVGKIPKSWSVKSIGSLSSKVIDGPHKTPTYVDSGVPFITVRNITSGKIVFENLKYITEEDHIKFCKRSRAEIGDILYSKDGTIGFTCVVETKRIFSFFVSVALIKPRKELIHSHFLNHTLQSPFVKYQTALMSEGSGLKHMVLRSIKALLILLPTMDEQIKFSEILDKYDALLDCSFNKLEKIKQLKKGLMKDLLTGKIRVEV